MMHVYMHAPATFKKKDMTDLCIKTPLLTNNAQSFTYDGR